MSSQTPDVTISLVSYNTCALLRACLASLQARRKEGEVSLEVVVADNSSDDGSVDMVRDEFPWARLIETGGNLGYGRANNVALEQARGRYFLVLNSDTEVEPGTLAALRDFLDSHPAAVAVGGQLVLPDGSPQLSCARDPNLWAVFREQTFLEKLLPKPWRTGSYAGPYKTSAIPQEVEQIVGACLFVRREAWEQAGGFDPAYFMYFEDVDFCVRLRRAGGKIYFLPDARIRHHLGASSRDWQGRARMITSYNQSRCDYFHRQGGPARATALKALVLLGAGLRTIIWRTLAIARPDTRDQAALFQSVWRQTRTMKCAGRH